MLKLLSNKYLILVFIFVYRILLDKVYINCTNIVWEYVGFDNIQQPLSFQVSWGVLILLSLLVLPYFNSKDSFVPDIIIIIFLLRVVPYTSLIRFLNYSESYVLFSFIFWSLLIILPYFIKLRDINLNIGHNRGEVYVNGLLIVFSFVVLFISGFYAHFRLHLTFDDVYELRHEASSFKLPLLLRYLWSATTNILPLLFVYFLKKRKGLVCCLIAFVIILNFSINGMKSTIFKLLLCLILMSVSLENVKRWYVPSFITVAAIGLIEKLSINTQFFHDLVIRRALYIPSLLDTFYYDYISVKGPVYYDRSGTPVQYIIGENYMKSIEVECNNGLFSDAFMNLGDIGCFIYPFIYAVFFRFCSSAFRGADKGLVVFSALIMPYTISGSEFTTALLTHGLFLFCLTMYIISSNQQNSDFAISNE